MSKIDLSELGGGAVAERFAFEIEKVLQNIYDPNTDPKKARKVTVELTLKGDENRDVVLASVRTKSTLAPTRDVETKILMGMDNTGRIVGAELKSGVKDQMMIDDAGDVTTDTGHKVGSNVVGFNALTK